MSPLTGTRDDCLGRDQPIEGIAGCDGQPTSQHGMTAIDPDNPKSLLADSSFELVHECADVRPFSQRTLGSHFERGDGADEDFVRGGQRWQTLQTVKVSGRQNPPGRTMGVEEHSQSANPPAAGVHPNGRGLRAKAERLPTPVR
jgi:hypothetical protein